jgi:hypothetical protein
MRGLRLARARDGERETDDEDEDERAIDTRGSE